MKDRLKFAVLAIVSLAGSLSALAQCGFAFEPAAETRWYRNEGWIISGLKDAKVSQPIRFKDEKGNVLPSPFPEGITVSVFAHDFGYRVTFPEAIFDKDGKKTKMLSRSFILYSLIRWEIDGKPYAYSYDLGPLDVACAASIEIIDDKGDGIFRLMTTNTHSLLQRKKEAPPIPAWARPPKS